MKKKVFICTLHDEIMEMAEELLRYEFESGQKTKGKKLLKKIITKAEEAKYGGQEMEDRLVEYYEAITGLGFKRKK